jgi:hypothetical protein
MKTTFIFLTTIILFSSASAQTAGKAAFVELGGAGLASANFDMRLMKKNDGLGFRVGVGGFSVKNSYSNGFDKTTALFIPLDLNYLLGKDGKHYFELGAGATIVSVKETNSYNDPYYSDYNNDKFNSTFGHLYFGYRIQPKDGGFLFRAGLTPVFGKGFFIPYLPAVSFGYKF